MSQDKQYGVLHEIGDYYQPKPLSPEDNRAINEQINGNKNKKQPINEDKNN